MNPQIYDPSITASKAVPPAKRPASLAGKVVGLYDNTKEQANIILEVLNEELLKQYAVKAVITRRGDHYSKPAPASIVEEMAAKCDVVVCALGG